MPFRPCATAMPRRLNLWTGPLFIPLKTCAGAPAFLKNTAGRTVRVFCANTSRTPAAGLQDKSYPMPAQYIDSLPITYKTEFTTDEAVTGQLLEAAQGHVSFCSGGSAKRYFGNAGRYCRADRITSPIAWKTCKSCL